MAIDDDQLIARYVEMNPHHPGPGNVWMKDSAVPVWAIIGHVLANECGAASTSQAAANYDIPEIEVEAALAFYRSSKWAIDARLAETSQFELPVAVPAAQPL